MLRWAGVLFLLYLAWDGWKTPSTSSANSGVAKGWNFLWGLVTNLLNPKAGVFYVAVLPTFIDATARPMAQTIMLTATYVGVATLVHLVIVVRSRLRQTKGLTPCRLDLAFYRIQNRSYQRLNDEASSAPA